MVLCHHVNGNLKKWTHQGKVTLPKTAFVIALHITFVMCIKFVYQTWTFHSTWIFHSENQVREPQSFLFTSLRLPRAFPVLAQETFKWGLSVLFFPLSSSCTLRPLLSFFFSKELSVGAPFPISYVAYMVSFSIFWFCLYIVVSLQLVKFLSIKNLLFL